MMLTPVSMAAHDQICHVAPHFDCLDLWNAIVPLPMPSASCDTNASASVVI